MKTAVTPLSSVANGRQVIWRQSHSKAKQKGYRDFWTIISKKGLFLKKLQGESQTTTMWFDEYGIGGV